MTKNGSRIEKFSTVNKRFGPFLIIFYQIAFFLAGNPHIKYTKVKTERQSQQGGTEMVDCPV